MDNPPPAFFLHSELYSHPTAAGSRSIHSGIQKGHSVPCLTNEFLKKTEEEIAALEARNAEIDERSSLPEICTNMSELLKLTKEKEENDTS